MNCLFCGTERDAKRVDSTAKSYICSNCVQTLVNLSQEQLRKAYDLATEKGYSNKAKAIESFITEAYNVSRNKRSNTTKYIDRNSPLRTVGHEQGKARRFKKPKRASLYQIEQN